MLLLAVILYLSLRYRREPTTRRLVLLGLSLGLLALDRAELSLLGLLLAVPAFVAVARRSAAPWRAVLRRRPRRRGPRRRGGRAVDRVQPAALPRDRAHLERPRPDARRGELPERYYGPLTGYDAPCYLAVLRSESEGAERGRGRRLLPAHGRRLRPAPLGALARRRGPARAVAVEPVAPRVDRAHVRRLHRAPAVDRVVPDRGVLAPHALRLRRLRPCAAPPDSRRAPGHPRGLHRGDRAARRRPPPLPAPRRARLGAARARSRSTGWCSGRREATSAPPRRQSAVRGGGGGLG